MLSELLDLHKHKCILDVSGASACTISSFVKTAVLNNYEQVSRVLNLGAHQVQSSTFMPTLGPRGKRGEKRQ